MTLDVFVEEREDDTALLGQLGGPVYIEVGVSPCCGRRAVGSLLPASASGGAREQG